MKEAFTVFELLAVIEGLDAAKHVNLALREAEGEEESLGRMHHGKNWKWAGGAYLGLVSLARPVAEPRSITIGELVALLGTIDSSAHLIVQATETVEAVAIGRRIASLLRVSVKIEARPEIVLLWVHFIRENEQLGANAG